MLTLQHELGHDFGEIYNRVFTCHLAKCIKSLSASNENPKFSNNPTFLMSHFFSNMVSKGYRHSEIGP